ncbi:hypothetical protein LWI28_019816 [Acer negundo]|uniref:Uncharacterized protein n=1 Tax=Acer negundo TaxID=4023 RepID=A0AAD5NTL2_ACENE|nr:hypothetical protein LWI28_019816 [Acer negundo]
MLIIHRRILATTPRPSLPSSTTTSAVASDALILCGQGGKKTKRGSVLKTKSGRLISMSRLPDISFSEIAPNFLQNGDGESGSGGESGGSSGESGGDRWLIGSYSGGGAMGFCCGW